MPPDRPDLTLDKLRHEARQFADIESADAEPNLYGVTDGKAIGTYLEQKFNAYLARSYCYQPGNSASGIDLPGLNVDIKVTSSRQPQSSCPFRSASQKIFGLGYHLLVFVYDKYDDDRQRTGRLAIRHALFIDRRRTGDFQTTTGILEILERDGNRDDLVAFMWERNLPVDEVGAYQLAERILQSPPERGYLTVSNALQWRLQYSRALQHGDRVPGIINVR